MYLDESDQDYSGSFSSQSVISSHQVVGDLNGRCVYWMRFLDPASENFDFDHQACSQPYNIQQKLYARVRTQQEVQARKYSIKPPNFMIKQQQFNENFSKSRLKYHSLDKQTFDLKKSFKEDQHQLSDQAETAYKSLPIKRNKRFIRSKKQRKDKRRLKIQVVETKIGVVLDLRQLRESWLQILKKRQKKKNGPGTIQKRDNIYSNLTPTTFPSLLVLKNHKLASQSVKLFMRQLSQKYQDSLEIIRQDRQKKLIWCAPPPAPPKQQQNLPNLSAWLYENDQLISMSDSETFVDQEDWLMDIQSHNQDYIQDYCQSSNSNFQFFDDYNQGKHSEQISFAENQVLCIQNVQNFSKLIGFSSSFENENFQADYGYIDL